MGENIYSLTCFYHYNSKARRAMGIGTLDTTFSIDGKLEQDLGRNDTAIGTVIQSDGKIAVVGITESSNSNIRIVNFYLRRYNLDGTDDTLFNENAKNSTPALIDNEVRDVASIIQKDGYFYVVGSTRVNDNSPGNIFIAKYRADGSLDTGFGGQSGDPVGFSFVGTVADDEVSWSSVVQNDGKIVVVGSVLNAATGDQDILISRFNPNGILDASFGSGGKVITNIGSNDVALDVTLQKVGTEERIVITGSTAPSASKDIIVIRYLSTGALDSSFNSSGIVQTSFGSGDDIGKGVVILPGDKIFVVGETTSTVSSGRDFALARYNSDGSPDLSFAPDGKKTINVSGVFGSASGADGATRVKLDNTGKIVVLGYVNSVSTGTDAALVRLNLDGSLDLGFGNAGILLTPIGANASKDVPVSIDISAKDNSVVIAGSSSNAQGLSDSFIAKYQGDVRRAALGPDFNSDGNRDLVWRNSITGTALTWFLNGTTYIGESNFPNTVTDQNWKITSLGDFNKDGKDDLLWRNSVTGQNLVWFMNGTVKIGEREINDIAGNNRRVLGDDWKIKATADFNKDGYLDILWRNGVTGQNVVWNLGGSDGTTYKSESTIGPSFTGGWDIRAAADFNLDGNVDIVWRNSISGPNLIWYLGGTAGTTYQREQSILRVDDANWNIFGSGDFNKDGEADLLWRNSANGQNQVWALGGTTELAFLNLSTVSSSWSIQATGDFNGDGKEDLVWRNSLTGVALTWFLNGATYNGESNFSSTVTDQNWQIVSAGDFDKDGKDDLFWRNRVTGQNLVWFMNGTAKIGEREINDIAGNNRRVLGDDWKIKATADFNKDGYLDILWRNGVTGQNVVWNLGGSDGTTYQSENSIGPAFTGGWDIRTAADFNLDGNVDIAWRNAVTGADVIWYVGGINGTTYQNEQSILSVADSNWNVVGSGDFNQDGETDLLWRNSVSGQNQVWALGGTTTRAFLNVTAVPSEWVLL
jgi:uncharacterized delta-60 repeat protein